MKKTLQILAFVITAILYCGVMFQYSGQGGSDFSREGKQESKGSYSARGTDLFCHTVQTHTALKVVGKPQPTSLKVPFGCFLSVGQASEQLFFRAFSRFTFRSQESGVHFGSTDIIFPFHYFW